MTYFDALRMGRIEDAKKIFEETNELPDKSLAWYSAIYCKLDFLEWLSSLGIMPQNTIYHRLFDMGEMDSVEWLLNKGIQPDPETLSSLADLVASKGYLDMLKRLNLEPTTRGANCATEHGHIDVVKWLIQQGIYPDDHGANMAVANDHFDILKLLEPVGVLPNAHAFCLEMGPKNLEVLDWLFERGIYQNLDVDPEYITKYYGKEFLKYSN